MRLLRRINKWAESWLGLRRKRLRRWRAIRRYGRACAHINSCQAALTDATDPFVRDDLNRVLRGWKGLRGLALDMYKTS